MNYVSDAVLIALINRGRLCPARRLSVLFFHPQGKGPALMNPITAPSGSTILYKLVGTDDAGNPALLTPPATVSADGLAGATVTPDDPSGLTGTIVLPGGTTGTLTVTATAGGLSGTGTINVAEGQATKLSVDFQLKPTGPTPAPAAPAG